MKIEKFNENYNQKKELYDFIESIVQKFFGEDVGNMSSYDCILTNHKIALSFYFMAIDEDELKILESIKNYIRKFDNSTRIVFRPFELKDSGEQLIEIEHLIMISLTGYKDICDDLEILKNAKIYNV